MSGVYTSLAKMRSDQSKETIKPVTTGSVAQRSQSPSPALTQPQNRENTQSKKTVSQSPPPLQVKKTSKNLANGKTQISAVVTYEQKAVMLDLESKFNRRNKVVGKGDIAGIGLDAVSRILKSQTPLFSSLDEIKAYVNKVIDKALEP